jgi:hypothetical protein
MNRDKNLDAAADKILKAFEGHLRDLSPEERESKWSDFHKSAATLETRAKPEERPKTLRAPHSTQG